MEKLGVVPVTLSHWLDTGFRKDRHRSLSRKRAQCRLAHASKARQRHDFTARQNRPRPRLRVPAKDTHLHPPRCTIRALLNEGGRGRGVAQRLRHTPSGRLTTATTAVDEAEPQSSSSAAQPAQRAQRQPARRASVFSPAGRSFSVDRKANGCCCAIPLFSPPPPPLAGVGNGETRAARSGKRSDAERC